MKEPLGKRFFIVSKFVICKILSIKVNSPLARALETVGSTQDFSASDLKFYFQRLHEQGLAWLTKTDFKMADYNQSKNPINITMVFWTKFLKFQMSKISQQSK